jgi:hypothetical protein
MNVAGTDEEETDRTIDIEGHVDEWKISCDQKENFRGIPWSGPYEICFTGECQQVIVNLACCYDRRSVRPTTVDEGLTSIETPTPRMDKSNQIQRAHPGEDEHTIKVLLLGVNC